MENLEWITAVTLCGHPADCVAVAALPDGGVAMRDTKDEDPAAPVLRFTREEFSAFMEGMKLGHFDGLI